MTDDRWIVVPNWDKFQHYGNRRTPPWIKVYLELIHKPEWEDLTFAERGLLVTIWVHYAASRGHLRQSQVRPKSGLRHFQDHLKSLSDAGFIHLFASNVLAQREEEDSEDSDLTKKPFQENVDTKDLAPDLLEKIQELRGATPSTVNVINAFHRRGLPEAAFRTALEVTREEQRRNEIQYFVGTLRQMEQDGQYQ